MDLTKCVALGAQCAKGGVFVWHVMARLGDARAPCLALALAAGGRFA